MSYGAEPATAEVLRTWLDSVMRPALAEVEEAGWKTSPYIEWVDPLDPKKGIDLGPSAASLRDGLHAAPRDPVDPRREPRPEAVRREGASERRVPLGPSLPHRKGARPAEGGRTAAMSAARSAPVDSPFVLAAETDLSRPEQLDFPGFAWSQLVSPVTGRPRLVYDPAKPVSVPMPVYRHAKAKATTPRPAAYLVPAGWPRIEEKLAAHGVRFSKLTQPRTLAVGTYRAREAKLESAPYQGRVRVSAKIAKATETRTVPAGSLYVPLDTRSPPS